MRVNPAACIWPVFGEANCQYPRYSQGLRWLGMLCPISIFSTSPVTITLVETMKVYGEDFLVILIQRKDLTIRLARPVFIPFSLLISHNVTIFQGKSLHHVQLYDPMDHSPPGSSVHGILQARILEWVAMPSSRGSSWSRDWTRISYISWIDRRVLYHKCHLGSPLSTVALCKDHGDIEIKLGFYLLLLLLLSCFSRVRLYATP